ncbi:unnamed protein product [Cylicostephanus goldi]|uniref:Uncharacterized protein n=1 Tax=Cylicostephanus goldi TaxID=71465 RepID=A0A3P7MEY2_CYLGO|nr:unnamed protein product [Cylicostephanus goldi]
MINIAADLLYKSGQGNTAGIWAYGYVGHMRNFQPMFYEFGTSWTEFAHKVSEIMTFNGNRLFPYAEGRDYNVQIFRTINTNDDPNEEANCLVFFSAM